MNALSWIKIMIFSILNFFLIVVNTWVGLYFNYIEMLKNSTSCHSEHFSKTFIFHLGIGLLISLILYYMFSKKIGKYRHYNNLNILKTKKIALVTFSALSLLATSMIGLTYFYIKMASLITLNGCSAEMFRNTFYEFIPYGIGIYIFFLGLFFGVNYSNNP